jgi:GYF domain 2
MQIYINKNNQQLGPFDESKVLEMLNSGELSANDLGIKHGGENWQRLGELFPNSFNKPIIHAEIAPKKSRKGLLLGCGGFFLIALLVGGVLGFLAYRNMFPTGTAENLPAKIGNFQVEDPNDLSSPKGNIWGSEKRYVAKYKNAGSSYAIIILTDYSSEAAATSFYDTLPTSEWCKGDDPLYISYKKSSVETSKVTYCKSIFVKQKNQVFNVVVLSTSRVEDSKNIMDNLPFNVGAAGEVKK